MKNSNLVSAVTTKKLNVKDIVFLALLSVILLLTSSLIMPVVMFTQIFALRNLFGALFFSFFCMIALQRVPKIGALSLIGLFTGAFLGFMSVIMLLNNLLGALLTEALVLLIFRDYRTLRARYFAAIIYIPLTLPISFLATWLIKNQSLGEQLQKPWLSLLLAFGTFAIAACGAFLGNKVAAELRKAGKLNAV